MSIYLYISHCRLSSNKYTHIHTKSKINHHNNEKNPLKFIFLSGFSIHFDLPFVTQLMTQLLKRTHAQICIYSFDNIFSLVIFKYIVSFYQFFAIPSENWNESSERNTPRNT